MFEDYDKMRNLKKTIMLAMAGASDHTSTFFNGKGKINPCMEIMALLLKFIVIIFSLCLGAGAIVSKLEKKKGWVKEHKPYGFYERELKRPLDFGLSLFAIIIIWPVMLVTAILVKLKLGSPILFKQERPGLGGKVFTIMKYRTMREGVGSDEERLTDFGKKLRATSLDELPELINIIKGDMSISGPRPLLVDYLDRYSEEQKHRHDVRPGLTSLSAAKERNLAAWEDRLMDDVKYVKKITFFGDLKILIDTVKIVFKKRGISSPTSATMEYFTGSEEN